MLNDIHTILKCSTSILCGDHKIRHCEVTPPVITKQGEESQQIKEVREVLSIPAKGLSWAPIKLLIFEE